VLARLRPVGHEPAPDPVPLRSGQPIKLSRFAVIRVERGCLVAQAPRSVAELILAPSASGLIGALADWTTPDRLPDVGLPAAAVHAALPLFAAAGLLAPGGPDADTEADAPARAQWTVPDLWLHARSRGPRLSTGYGPVYPMAARFPPLPARADPDTGPCVALSAPASRPDLTVTEALNRRRSIREQDQNAPLTAEQLGDLLGRTTRVRRTFITSGGAEAAVRPYPSGGAAHELEIYPLVTRCTGLDAGLWHYRADEHQLRLISRPDRTVQRMVAAARQSCLMDGDPQVVLIIAARFGRVMWKYDAIAYSLILKDVGIYMQTVYLAATAIGLAVCAVGGGDAADFAAVTGLDYYAQGSVGEMVLGSLPRE
jgi:SagB-type dehydrogenase family enzyme